MLRLIEHLQYLNQRKQELEKETKHSLINKLVIKELEIREWEKTVCEDNKIEKEEMKCDYCNETFDDCQCDH